MIPTWGQPRLCEEHGRGGVVAHELYGATPLIRGTPSRCCFLACVLLLNPDYAGRAWPTLTEYVGLGATPQMRGTLVSALANPRLYGSPPHMRGTPARPSPAVLVRRITPAYARNTNLAPWPLRHYDSPLTIRGTLFEHVGTHMQCGPSPSMRGTRRYPAVAVEGFTPAHAGNTARPPASPRPSEVHPRTCGEYGLDFFSNKRPSGSPPHMRGTLLSDIEEA